MNQVKIRNRHTGAVIYEDERTLSNNIEEAIWNGISLVDADLSGADLSCVGLSDVDFSGADFSCAILSRANLDGANFSGARLTGATIVGTDLSRADFAGAIFTGAILSGSNFAGLDLSEVNFADACLRRANFTCADLTYTDFTRADLFGANLSYADFFGANLSYANVTRANLTDATLFATKLFGVNLDGAIFDAAGLRPATHNQLTERARRYRARHPHVPAVERLDQQILERVKNGAGRLEMDSWHTCETTHCLAGWAIYLAGEAGAKLEAAHGSRRAGAMIYRASTGRTPNFFASTEKSLADLRKRAAESEGA